MPESRRFRRHSRMSRMPLIVSVALLTGCAIRPVSGLPFPEKPALHGSWVGEQFCLPREDANALTVWVQELGAFKRAYTGR